jgi:predicted nucleic acid-binding protein
MRRYLVDTTPMAALLNNRPPAIAFLRPQLANRELATSLLVYGEVVESLKSHADFPRRHAGLRALLRLVSPYVLSYPIMELYADLRRQLRPPHGPGLIGDIDTLIAATALTYDLELITTDSDFRRVPGLKLMLLNRTTFQPVTQ